MTSYGPATLAVSATPEARSHDGRLAGFGLDQNVRSDHVPPNLLGTIQPPLRSWSSPVRRYAVPPAERAGVRGQNSNVIYPGHRPGQVLRFLPPEAEKAQSEARSAHSVGAYPAAAMMCLPGHKGGKTGEPSASWLRGTARSSY